MARHKGESDRLGAAEHNEAPLTDGTERDGGPWLVETRVEEERIIKKSRFIGLLVPVDSVEAAETVLSEVREAHKTANHNCYAYRIGIDGVPIERFSDDGEPSGTAGRPMLEVLRRRDLHNVIAVVTRYFGGTLLGASGLVHAYQDTTLAAVGAATLLRCVRMHAAEVTCDYGAYGRLEHALAEIGYHMTDRVFGADVSFRVYVPEGQADGFAARIADLTSGQALVEIPAARWMGMRPDGTFVVLAET
ncbi:YigZ family protein [Alicyclobacillus cycloheptanicus]|uniref:YigZ family protein n=1 Tax=Alicyclobacillus cycloheptanicus TaxID=1457 RepID=A0ABT9XGE0_9BACL|nr:YigZ family protein [Alicyclobacillus cycloheptanicus]MDQ0189374.1 putative YigZ family protein [Alicyclobacillus cycloheptanicus]